MANFIQKNIIYFYYLFIFAVMCPFASARSFKFVFVFGHDHKGPLHWVESSRADFTFLRSSRHVCVYVFHSLNYLTPNARRNGVFCFSFDRKFERLYTAHNYSLSVFLSVFLLRSLDFSVCFIVSLNLSYLVHSPTSVSSSFSSSSSCYSF